MVSFTPEQTELLKAKLDRSNVKERKMAGRNMSYVEGWHVIAEANRVFGFDGWTSETVLLQETNRDLVELESDRGKYKQWRIGYIAKVRISAGGIVREGTGYGSGMGKPEAIGDAVEGAIKEAETDARKRGLMTFGNIFGLALYDKEQTEVEGAPSKAPATTPAKPQEAQKLAPAPTPPPANQTPAITPEKWCQMGIDRVKTMDRKALDAFEEKYHQKIAQVRLVAPKEHEPLIAAIRKRHEELA